MYRLQHMRQSLGLVAGLAVGLIVTLTSPSAAFAALRGKGHAGPTRYAQPHLPPGYFKHPPLPASRPVHAALAIGMPGWQIVVIAVGAAVAGAAIAVLTDRAWSWRRQLTVRVAQ